MKEYIKTTGSNRSNEFLIEYYEDAQKKRSGEGKIETLWDDEKNNIALMQNIVKCVTLLYASADDNIVPIVIDKYAIIALYERIKEIEAKEVQPAFYD